MEEEELTQETPEETEEIQAEPENVVATEEEKPEEPKAEISCRLDEFELKICRPQKTAVIFLGKGAENIDNILSTLNELQGTLDMDIGVLDMADKDCADLSEKYKIDQEATQLVVFENCEKVSGISLEGDYKEQVGKLKESLEKQSPPEETSGEEETAEP